MYQRLSSTDEIDRGIRNLQVRIGEVESLARAQVRFDDMRIQNVIGNIRKTILEVFGGGSEEYRRHVNHDIWDGPLNLSMSDGAKQRAFQAGIPRTVTMLEGLVSDLERRRQILSGSAGHMDRTFEHVQLHPRIRTVSERLFLDGHYRNAVLDAYLALERFVQEKSGCCGVDGADLMRRVFSKRAPILAFNDRADESQLNEQEGFMHIFEGVALALRNPRAHSLVSDTAEEALEYLGLLSLLANRMEKVAGIGDS